MAETDECSDCDVGKVLVRRIGAIDRRLKQVLRSNILNPTNEDTLHPLHSSSLGRDSYTKD